MFLYAAVVPKANLQYALKSRKYLCPHTVNTAHAELGTHRSKNQSQFPQVSLYEGHLESKERFAIKKYLLITGKKKNMQVLSHIFTFFYT